MDWQELMWKADAEAFVAMLADGCGVKSPKMSFAGRTKHRGFYRRSSKTITVGKWTKPWILTHEFAHYLDHVENGCGVKRSANNREPHSQAFFFKLRRLVNLLGGDGYPWDSEYKQIARWAKNMESV